MKSERAITMTVLIFTIIILLVFAGITISYVVGDNSTISRATEASFETEINQIIELMKEKEDLLNLEGDTILTESDKQAILQERYDLEDVEKRVMDIKVEGEKGELKLILKYKGDAFNKRQIDILNKKGAKGVEEL